MNKQQLAAKIWESANKMRSKIEANEYKDYILGFIFYKFLSEKEVKYLKENGVWICGTDINTSKYYDEQDLTGPIAIVIGSEGFGMSRLVKENCDFLIKIPMKGHITSLNAAVSTGIVVYEAVKQRKNN